MRFQDLNASLFAAGECPCCEQGPGLVPNAGAKLRVYRKELGVKSEDVAQALGITRSYFYMLERGDRPFSLDQIQTYLETLQSKL